MNIAFDIDGVLTDIGAYQLKYGVPFFKRKYGLEVTNPNKFNIKEIFNCTDEQEMTFWKQYLLHYCITEPARMGAKELFNYLNNSIDTKLYIITVRYFAAKQNIAGKIMRTIVREWLKINGLNVSEIIFCDSSKLEAVKKYQIDVIFEDSPKNIEELSQITNVICFDAKYNRNCQGKNIYRINHFNQAYDLLHNIYCKNNNKLQNKLTLPSLDKIWIEKYYNDIQKQVAIPNMSIYDYMYQNNSNNLQAVALKYFGHNITFEELFHRIDVCAQSLTNQFIKKGDIVSICMPNTPEAVIAFYAINKIGAIADMIHPLSSADEIMQYLNSNNSKLMFMADLCYKQVNSIIYKTNLNKVVVISPSDSMPVLLASGYAIMNYKNSPKITYDDKYLSWKNFMKPSKINIDMKNNLYQNDNLAVLLHTGGTTGKPKAVMLSNENINANVSQLRTTIPYYKKGDTLLAIPPIFHGFGLVDCIHTGLSVGLSIDLLPQFNQKLFANALLKSKPNLILGPPSVWDALTKNEKLKYKNLDFLKVLISGGDHLYPTLEHSINKFLQEHNVPHNIHKGLGMTEGVAAITFTGLGANPLSSVGIPLPLNNFKVVKPGTCEELGYNEIGEICFNGPTMMLGYYNDINETNLIIKTHSDEKKWLHTGDIGYIDEKGILFFTDRLKRIIISSGYNVYPSTIETIINSHNAIANCAVVSCPHKNKVNVPKVYIKLKQGYNDKEKIISELQEMCRQNLAKFSWPAEYEIRDQLPMTSVGKVDYKILENETINEYYNQSYNKPKIKIR